MDKTHKMPKNKLKKLDIMIEDVYHKNVTKLKRFIFKNQMNRFINKIIKLSKGVLR